MGPDGFNFSFIRRFWPLVRDDVGIMCVQFHQFSSFLYVFSFYFFTLILKVISPSQMGDFRPISIVVSYL